MLDLELQMVDRTASSMTVRSVTSQKSSRARAALVDIGALGGESAAPSTWPRDAGQSPPISEMLHLTSLFAKEGFEMKRFTRCVDLVRRSVV